MTTELERLATIGKRQEHDWEPRHIFEGIQKCVVCAGIRQVPVGDGYFPSSCPKDFARESFARDPRESAQGRQSAEREAALGAALGAEREAALGAALGAERGAAFEAAREVALKAALKAAPLEAELEAELEAALKAALEADWHSRRNE